MLNKSHMRVHLKYKIICIFYQFLAAVSCIACSAGLSLCQMCHSAVLYCPQTVKIMKIIAIRPSTNPAVPTPLPLFPVGAGCW